MLTLEYLKSVGNRTRMVLSLLLVSVSMHANPVSSDYVLLINSDDYRGKWAYRIFQTVNDAVEKEFSLKVASEALSMKNLNTKEDIDSQINFFHEKYSTPPQLVVFVRDPAYYLCQPLFETVWKDVPAIICLSMDVIPTKPEYFFLYNDLPDTDFINSQELLKDRNVATIEMSQYMKETVELMKHLMPEITNIAFIADNQYYSTISFNRMKKIQQEFFPDMNLELLQYPQTNTDKLLEKVRTYDKTTGIIYHSWIDINFDESFNYFPHEKIEDYISNVANLPIFTLSDIAVQDSKFAGGHVISFDDMQITLAQTIKSVLNGKPAGEIGAIRGGKPADYLNYSYLRKYDIPKENYPADAIYYDKPNPIDKQKIFSLLTIATLIAFITILLVMRNRIIKLKKNQIEKEVRLSSVHENLINNMPVIYFQKEMIPDKKGNITDFIIRDVNRAFEKYFGIKKRHIVNKRFDVIRKRFPVLDFIEKKTQGMSSIVIPTIHNENRYFDKLMFEASGKNLVDVFCIDKTDAHKVWLSMEEHRQSLEKILDNLPIAVKVKDVENNMKYLFWNKKAAELFEFSAEEALGKTDCDIIGTDAGEQLREEDSELVRTGIPLSGIRHFYDKKGEERYILQKNNLISLSDRKKWIIYTAWDITRMKMMERELRKAKEKAEESNRLKSAFLANMSHEIRTPLNAIVGFSSILAFEDDENDKKEYLTIIEHNNNLLLRLIDDLLDLAKIETGTFEFSYSEVDINEILIEIEQTVRLKNLNPDVDLVRENPIPHLKLHTDRSRIFQVMSNFIDNAIKFTGKGIIRFGYKLVENNSIYFYVTDTGTGIPPEKQKKIFDRFIKLDTFEQGTGLGLSISKSIIERMGGKIGVESQAGEGSTFWFILPYSTP